MGIMGEVLTILSIFSFQILFQFLVTVRHLSLPVARWEETVTRGKVVKREAEKHAA
jgi:hypothetical protein